MKALKSCSSTDPVFSKSQGLLGKREFLKMEATSVVRFQRNDFNVKLIFSLFIGF